LVLTRTNQKNPPLAFGAREGVAVVVEVDENKKQNSPPLAFAAREGMVVVGVNENEI
jgi:hypothetical protein